MPKAAQQCQETGKNKSSPFTVKQELETWGGPPGTTEDQQSIVALWVRETMEVLVEAGSCWGREGRSEGLWKSHHQSQEKRRDEPTQMSMRKHHLARSFLTCAAGMSLLCIGTGSSAFRLVRSSTTSSFISKLSRHKTMLCSTQHDAKNAPTF